MKRRTKLLLFQYSIIMCTIFATTFNVHAANTEVVDGLTEDMYIEELTEGEAHEINSSFEIIARSISNSVLNISNAEVREAVKTTSNYDEYLLFIQGYGGTEDEYWENQRGLVKKELIIGRYVQALEKEIIDESGIEEDSIEGNNALVEEVNNVADELAEDYEVILK